MSTAADDVVTLEGFDEFSFSDKMVKEDRTEPHEIRSSIRVNPDRLRKQKIIIRCAKNGTTLDKLCKACKCSLMEVLIELSRLTGIVYRDVTDVKVCNTYFNTGLTDLYCLIGDEREIKKRS